MSLTIKGFVTLLLLFSLCSTGGAQTRKLLAHYPLSADGKEKNNRVAELTMTNISFQNNAAYTDGVYGDFDNNEGNLIITPPITGLDYNQFSVSVWFRVTEYKKMPVIVMGRACRLLAFYLLSEGAVMLTANNMEVVKPSKTHYQLNQWHKATLTYANQTATLFLDDEQAAQTTVSFSSQCLTEWLNNDLGIRSRDTCVI